MSSATLGAVYSLAAAVFWSFSVILFRKCGNSLPPIPLNFFKNTLALVLFAATIWVMGIPWIPDNLPEADLFILVGSGVLGVGIADVLFIAGLNRLGAVRSAIISVSYSPTVLACTIFMLPFSVTPVLLGGMAVTIVGVALGVWEHPSTKLQRRDWVLGTVLVYSAIATMSFGIVWAQPILVRTNAVWATTVRLFSGWLLLLIPAVYGPYRGHLLKHVNLSEQWRLLVPAAVLGTYFALLFWILGYKHGNPIVASIVAEMSNVLIFLWAGIFLKESLGIRRIAAILIACAGAALATLAS